MEIIKTTRKNTHLFGGGGGGDEGLSMKQNVYLDIWLWNFFHTIRY